MLDFLKIKFSSTETDIQNVKDDNLVALEKLLRLVIKEKFASKLKLHIIDSGSCNACELELQLLFSPMYDLSSFGVEVVYDAVNADILVVTGLITENIYLELQRAYEKLKVPKQVILIGDCPLFVAPFHNTFALKDKGNKLFTSAFHLKGCPPEPKDLLEGLYIYLKKL